MDSTPCKPRTVSLPGLLPIGLASVGLGLIWDVAQHLHEPAGVDTSGLALLTNSAHQLLALGVCLIAAEGFVTLAQRQRRLLAARSARPATRVRLVFAAVLLLSFGLAAAIWQDELWTHQIASAEGDPVHANLSDQGAHAETGSAVAPHDSSHLLHVSAGDLEVTEAQQTAADTLVAETRASSKRFIDVEEARAAGYAELGGGPSGENDLIYLFNQSFVREGTELNPERPEALAYLRAPSGLHLVGALYLAPAGGGPRVGGGLTIWDRYSPLCLDQSFTVVAVLGSRTGCPEATNPLASPPDALHVWTFDHPNGPFAPSLTEAARQTALRQITG